MATVQDALNDANPNDLPTRFHQVQIGDVLSDLLAAVVAVPVERVLSGLSSSATHVHDVAARITTVALSTTTLTIMAPADTPAAGEVGITYNPTTGVPTLVFGDGVNTAYTVTETPLSTSTLAALLALEV